MSQTLLAVATSFILTLLAIPVALVELRRKQVIDFPTSRSSHTYGVVRGIGIAQACAVVVTYLIFGPIPPSAWIAVIGFSLLGFADDVKHMGVASRLLIQMVLAFAAISVFTMPIWTWSPLVALQVFFAAVGLSGFVNATNFMDGINGISIAHGALWGLVYLVLLASLDLSGWAVVCSVLLGVSVAVLPWNWGRHAKAFLGDAGSYLLGSTVGLLALLVLEATRNPLVAFGPLAIYLVDTGVTLFLRAWRREPLLKPHKEHVFQRLSRSTNHQIAALIVVAFSGLMSLVALAVGRNLIPTLIGYGLMIVLIVAYLACPRALQPRGPG